MTGNVQKSVTSAQRRERSYPVEELGSFVGKTMCWLSHEEREGFSERAKEGKKAS